jgi:hypothetical protein
MLGWMLGLLTEQAALGDYCGTHQHWGACRAAAHSRLMPGLYASSRLHMVSFDKLRAFCLLCEFVVTLFPTLPLLCCVYAGMGTSSPRGGKKQQQQAC